MPGTDVSRIAIVHIPVAGQERSLAFYRDVLGMDVAIDNPVMPGVRWLHLRQKGITPAREDLGTPFGDFVEVADPDGNRLALWQPAPGMDIASIEG
jgi:catechol 2,3-dioxygenase-like lactoylglutathione lyase family enzyme